MTDRNATTNLAVVEEFDGFCAFSGNSAADLDSLAQPQANWLRP